MNPRRVGAVLLRQFYLLRGSPARAAPLVSWVAVDMALWGFMARYLDTMAPRGFDFIPAVLGAVLFWDFFLRVMQGVTMAFFEDVWSRNFLNFFSTPLTVPEYLAGLVVSSIATSALGLIVMVLLASGAFGLRFLDYGAAIAPFMLILLLFGIALGIMACALVLRLGPASEWLVWPIPALIAPFAGVFYPLSVLPVWMRAFSRLLPPAYVFESLRAIVAGRPAPAASLPVAAALSGAYVLLGGWIFARTYRLTVRSGLLARYSAESVG